jgi:hypothetical protein
LRLGEVSVRAPGPRAVHENRNLIVVGLRLCERVVESDVDGVLDGFVGIDLGNDHPVPVLIEHVRHADEHHLVVIHQRHRDGSAVDRSAHGSNHNPPKGVTHQP